LLFEPSIGIDADVPPRYLALACFVNRSRESRSSQSGELLPKASKGEALQARRTILKFARKLLMPHARFTPPFESKRNEINAG
jgi:hypothetical protein